MNHIDDERLAAYALDRVEPRDASDEEHLQRCDQCTAELDELVRLLSDTAGVNPLASPPEQLWTSIVTELESHPSHRPEPGRPIPIRDTSGHGDDSSSGRGAGSASRRWWTIGLVAALIGVLVGVLGTVVIRAVQSPPESVVAEIALEPLPGKAGTGQATLVQTSAGLQLRVSLSDITVRDADLEVWLINADGERMRSLGLAGDAGGTFNVPGWLIPDDYRIVDVSVEPHDGDLTHSTDSEVRGTLP